MKFAPTFQITPRLAKVLMDIEASRQAVSMLPVTSQILESLRISARFTTTHYSTQIEGNRLTAQQVKDVFEGSTFPNRERDEAEVKHYFQAIDLVDQMIEAGPDQIEEVDIQTLHGLVMFGKKTPTPYRDGQNVIRDSGSGNIIYMPPEAKDVELLMNDLVSWVNTQRALAEVPAPIIAAITHYQFATIHPYYDGNGRTARLLTNLVLHLSGYGLKGIYSLEEYYAQNLLGYYDALTVGPSHNYYLGRAEADISKWVLFFCEGMADAFAKVRLSVDEAARQNDNASDQSKLLRQLDEKQKRVLPLFREHQSVTATQIATLLGVNPRTARNWCARWVESAFLLQEGTSNKTRAYRLAEEWRGLIK